MAACFLLVAFATGASAQDIITQEPERYAFVVGQTTYSADGSTFETLGGACVEAMQFRERLIAIGWKRENIYPVVTPEGPTETPNDVRRTICNLSTRELSDALQHFAGEVSIDAPSPSLSLVYLSGHGAQSGGDQYIFGTDARVDFDVEVRRAQIADNYRMFQTSRVNVTQQVSVLDGIDGKAVFVIVDACRDNPPLDAYIQRARAAGHALDVDYIRSREQFSADRDFRNILILFSTRPGQAAAGAPMGSTTAFSQQMLQLIGEDTYQRLSVSAVAEEMRGRMRQAQRDLRSFERQIPDEFGLIRPRPVYCLWGCPQDAALWPQRERTRIIASAPPATRQAALLPPQRHAVVEAPAVLTLAGFSQDPHDAVATTVPARRTRTGADFRIDVFYCIDDDRAQQREAAALAFAEALRRDFPEGAMHDGRGLGTIRLRSLDANTNHRNGYRRIDNSIWVDRDNALEESWARRIANVNGGRLRHWPARTVTANYISVFFCEGANPDRVVDTVFTRVPVNVGAEQIGALLADLREHVPAARFLDPITAETAGCSAEGTHVRYYADSQQANAAQIAAGLQTLLNQPVTAMRARTPRGDGVRVPPIEVRLDGMAGC